MGSEDYRSINSCFRSIPKSVQKASFINGNYFLLGKSVPK
jgi:hypothetical protein